MLPDSRFFVRGSTVGSFWLLVRGFVTVFTTFTTAFVSIGLTAVGLWFNWRSALTNVWFNFFFNFFSYLNIFT